MSNDGYSSSNVTASNDDGLAACMMNLYIACRLVQWLPRRETSPAGNASNVGLSVCSGVYGFRQIGPFYFKKVLFHRC